MMPAQLKETTMDPKKRTLLRVTLDVADDAKDVADELVERLMGNKPEARFAFIQERAEFADEELLERLRRRDRRGTQARNFRRADVRRERRTLLGRRPAGGRGALAAPRHAETALIRAAQRTPCYKPQRGTLAM
jgi:hypothetical protein